MWMEEHIYSSVSAKIQAGNIRDKDIMTTQKGQSQKNQQGILKIYVFCQKI